MKAAVFAYSRQGVRTARAVVGSLGVEERRAYAPERLREEDFGSLGHPSEPFYGELFRWADVLVFVGACGIAVRSIAPHVRDKRTDPAVLCVDEKGTFVISLLSGHIGGANALAASLAEALGATPVVTTATDVNRRFSVDAWASENGCAISDMGLAKAVSARILEAEVPLHSDFPVATAYPGGVVPGDRGDLGISIGYTVEEPFCRTLRLVPRVLHLGIGCRKGIACDAVRRAVTRVLKENCLDPQAVKCAASIDLKAGEVGLIACCREWGWPLEFYSAEVLQAVPGTFTPSAFVREVTGVDNVCERAARMGADRLIVGKTALDGVTVAVAAENWEVRFG